MKYQIQWVALLSLSVAACSDGGDAGGGTRGLSDVCSDGCLVDSVCYPDGVLNPSNPCEICSPATSSTAFVPNDGQTCDDGAFCTVADTCAGGSCVGTTRSCDDEIACTGVETCDEDADLCGAGTGSCSAGQICDASSGECALACAGCLISDTCYGDGQVNPLNPCQVCTLAAAQSDWSANDGASCDDGLFCTDNDTCSAGACVGGGDRECGDGVSCNGTEACDEDADICAAGTSTCTANKICDVAMDSCTATCTGCVIDGVCYGDGQRNPTNSCEVCAPTSSKSSFSAHDGAQCDDGLFCTEGDVCTGTVCGGAARDCGDGVACNGTEICDEDADRCEAGSSTCASGQMCDVATDMCVVSCGAETTACTNMCVDTDNNPAHCGGCGTVCPSRDGAATTCVSGTCAFVCSEGLADCNVDPADGCEVDVSSDAANCGQCGLACGGGESCDAGNCVATAMDWLLETPCNGVDFGGGCTSAETGYHYIGEYEGYECWWHTKNQAWNTSTASNTYNLALQFGLDPATGVNRWCFPRSGTPTPSSYTGSYQSASNVGAWGWCGGAPFASGGYVCFLAP